MKRWHVRICVFLLLGAIVNIAVAWGLALSSPHHLSHKISSEIDALEIYNRSCPPDRSDSVAAAAGMGELRGVGGITYLIGSCWDQSSQGYPVACCVVQESRFGWPATALRSGFFQASFGAKSNIRSESLWIDKSRDRYLPTGVIWPGFAINTVFYAVVLWLLFAAPFVLRRWRRIRRGLCPKCAYDLRGSTAAICPECGATK